ncbi:hypothetical protein [Nitratireductor sp. ZSWI3]|uniref:hypothetical protein n=1 Tax=Nitratireductor sp. ZSWI3 TaxID=2966359 RepID=UPI0021503646|nr:hypothetical protein [Nitratireductor sp. ZSWI3]MCR4266158.1 hypothetical protein [Nitratireductor sp. ZSWI3]
MRRLSGIARTIGVLAALLAFVYAMSAAVFAVTGEAPAAFVVHPPGGTPANLPDDVGILRWEKHYAVVTSDRPDYVRRLYASGALMVLPFRKNGCLALSSEEGPA